MIIETAGWEAVNVIKGCTTEQKLRHAYDMRQNYKRLVPSAPELLYQIVHLDTLYPGDYISAAWSGLT